MYSVVCFKWAKTSGGHRLKTQVTYGAEHVNVLYRSVIRNTTLPVRFICVTDDPAGIDGSIEVVKLWDKCKYLGGCYNRLWIFSEEIKDLLGDRFTCIDLDSVIVSNIDSILTRSEPFIINRYHGKEVIKQKYNGGLITLTAGSRAQVWNQFDPITSPSIMEPLKQEYKLVGSDQAWIQYVLGTNEAVYDSNDGVYDYSFLPNGQLPDNAKMVFFPGKPDPSLTNHEWVKKHWHI